MKSFEKKVVTAMVAALVAAACCTSVVSYAQSDRYGVIDDGAAILDHKTGLVWKRCEEGKTWENGICRGLGIKFSWSDVERLSPGGWRLPTAEELKSLKEDTGVAPPINREYFPNTDRAWFWTSSAGTRDDSGCIQNVYFGDDIQRHCPLIRSGADQLALRSAYVRLVRVQ